MTATDILTGTGQTEMVDLSNQKYAGLYLNEQTYFLANAYNTSYLWAVYNYGSQNANLSYSSVEYGVRPVVSLKSNVKTSAMDTQGRWLIEIE